jgi:hypothetical protein
MARNSFQFAHYPPLMSATPGFVNHLQSVAEEPVAVLALPCSARVGGLQNPAS